MTDDDLARDPVVQHVFTKLEIYRAWYEAALAEANQLRVQRDALREELRRYVAARV